MESGLVHWGHLSLKEVSFVVGLLMGEGREDGIGTALVLGEVPSVVDGLGETTDHGLALLGDSLSVGVLMAHHHDGFTVDGQLVVELRVATLEVGNAAVKDVEGLSVILNKLSVVGDVHVVVVDSLIVVTDGLAGFVHAFLELGDGLAESLSTDEHVSGLGNLELVSVFTEKGAVGVESIDGLGELRCVGVCGGGGLVATVVVVGGVVVIVMIVQLVVVVGDLAVLAVVGVGGTTFGSFDLSFSVDLDGAGSSDEEKRSEYLHFSFDFTSLF